MQAPIGHAMTREEASRHTEIVAEISRQLSDNGRLRAELQRARREFFGVDDGGAQEPASEHRFVEWFLFDRESEALGAVPVTVDPYADMAVDIEDSIVGLFLIESVSAHCTARDVQNDEILEIEGRGTLQPGDLLVGRLYPAEQERWSASAATPALRPGRQIADAFVEDLGALEIGRRLNQIELEHLLLRRHGVASDAAVLADPPAEPLVPLEHLEADLDLLLKSVGGRHQADVISQQLAVAPGPGSLIGPLLDQLAFDTDVDLDKARRLMLEIWNAHHAGAGSAPADASTDSSGPPGESLGEQLVRRLDAGIGDKQDVEELFAGLERAAGITDDDEDDSDDQDAERDAALVERLGQGDGDAGDLAPLVTEFHWETDAEGAESSALSLWVELQRNAPVPVTDVESIGAKDIMRLLLHVYLRSAPTERAAQVRGAFDEMTRFYDWLAVTQEIDARDVAASCAGALLEHLDRLEAAGVALSNDKAPTQAPGLLQVEEIGADGFGARDDDGGSHWLSASAGGLSQLEVGDLLLAGICEHAGDAPTSLHRDLAGMVVVLPVDARSLID